MNTLISIALSALAIAAVYAIGIAGQLFIKRVQGKLSRLCLTDILTAALSPIASYALLCLCFGSLKLFLKPTPLFLILFCVIGISLTLILMLKSMLKALQNNKAGLSLFLCSLVLISALTALIAESSVFNYRALQSEGYEETDLTEYTVDKAEEARKYFVEFEKLGLSKVEIQNLYIRFENKEMEKTTVELYLHDDSNGLYTNAFKRALYSGSEESYYIPIHLSGESKGIRLVFESSVKDLKITKISLNTPRPFDFSYKRFATVMLITLFVSALISKYAKRSVLNFKKPKHSLSVCATVSVVMTVVFLLIVSNDNLLTNPLHHHSQYQELVRSLLDGKLYLLEEPPEFLKEMENPYDTAYRNIMVDKTGVSYHWDAAYFNGRYYVYFGIVPVIIAYLPYYLGFNADLPNAIAVLLFAMVAIIGIFLLVYAIYDRFLKNKNITLSVGEYLIFSILTVLGGGILFLACYPDLYAVPIISGIAFVSMGLSIWCLSCRFSKSHPFVFALMLFSGSLCMALSVGCRPQFALISFLALPIFWDCVFKDRALISKKGILQTASFALPYIVVAAFLMWYNYMRFGSVFDFGAAYNLTTNDVSNRGFVIDRLGTALFYYLIQFPNIDGAYPYLHRSVITTSYVGTTIYQDVYGGLLFQSPVCLYAALLPANKCAKQSKTAPVIFTLLLLGLVTVCVDAQMGGILQRYVCDFAMLFITAAMISYFSIKHSIAGCDGKNDILHKSLNIVFICTLIFCLLFLFNCKSINDFYEFLFWL